MSDLDKERIRDTVKMLMKQLDQFQDEVPELTDDYHRLFLYYVADQFENIAPNKLKVCDRQGDQKIDFYSVGEERFTVYQCKLPELDLLESNAKIKTYGAELVNEAEDILTFMTDDSGAATGNDDAQEARNKYREKKRISEEAGAMNKLEVVISFFGKFTPPAIDRLTELQNAWSVNGEESEYEITVVDFDKIESELSLSLMAKNRPKKFKLYYEPRTQVNTDQWGYALVPAKLFYDLFDNSRMALFDLNVRYYLKRSSVNKLIIRTLSEMKGQKNFHLLNNGVTISCTNWHFPAKRNEKNKDHCWFSLTKPQIINGCQTVISIYRAYRQMSEETLRRHFEQK